MCSHLRISSCLIILFLFGFIDNSIAKDTDVFIVVENHSIADLQKAIDSFNENNFNIYLTDVSGYNSTTYRKVICNLFEIYKNNLKKINECSNTFVRLEKSYTNEWTKELRVSFGMEYISDHIDEIKNLLMNINIKKRAAFCIDIEKDALYSEIQYIITLREFLQHFLNYYESLGQKKKNEFNKRKIFADEVLKTISVYPIQIMLYGGHINSYLDVDYHIALNPDVIKFIVNHKDLSHPFDPVVAFNDLLKVCGKK
jgi:hypothetical protein